MFEDASVFFSRLPGSFYGKYNIAKFHHAVSGIVSKASEWRRGRYF